MTTRDASRSVARSARAREVDALVEEIAEMMASGRWVTGKSHQVLARREGATVDAVQKWASAAGRMLRAMGETDLDNLRQRNAARLEAIVSLALDKVGIVRGKDGDSELVPQPDLKAAVSAIAEQGKLLGLNAPDKVHHSHEVARYEAADPRERLREVRDAIAALQAEEAELAAALGEVDAVAVLDP